MDFVTTLTIVRELRTKLNYITDLLEQLSEKVALIELTVNLQPMSLSDAEDSEEKRPYPPPPSQ